MLTEAEYDRLCRQACSFPVSPIAGETLEEAYWWVVCRSVHRHLGVSLTFRPVENTKLGDAYRRCLQQLVNHRRAEPFNSLSIPQRYIATALQKAGGVG